MVTLTDDLTPTSTSASGTAPTSSSATTTIDLRTYFVDGRGDEALGGSGATSTSPPSDARSSGRTRRRATRRRARSGSGATTSTTRRRGRGGQREPWTSRSGATGRSESGSRIVIAHVGACPWRRCCLRYRRRARRRPAAGARVPVALRPRFSVTRLTAPPLLVLVEERGRLPAALLAKGGERPPRCPPRLDGSPAHDQRQISATPTTRLPTPSSQKARPYRPARPSNEVHAEEADDERHRQEDRRHHCQRVQRLVQAQVDEPGHRVRRSIDCVHQATDLVADALEVSSSSASRPSIRMISTPIRSKRPLRGAAWRLRSESRDLVARRVTIRMRPALRSADITARPPSVSSTSLSASNALATIA